MEPMKPMEPMKGQEPWWPGDLGQPSTAGSEDDQRYADFADRRRLAGFRGGEVTVYDTADHRITGVSQHGDGGEGLLQTFRGTGSAWLAPTQDIYQRLQAGGFTTLASAPRSSNTDTAT